MPHLNTLPMYIVAVMGTFANYGCAPSSEPKDVAYYKAHPQELAKELNKCRNNPGQLQNNPECKNASSAAITAQGTETIPPVKF